MNTPEMSLRWVVEKWLAPSPVSPVRVTQFTRGRETGSRYVHIELIRRDGPIGIFFFRHDDGEWYVFPPEKIRQRIAGCKSPTLADRASNEAGPSFFDSHASADV